MLFTTGMGLVIFQLLFLSFFLFSNRRGKLLSNFLLGLFFLLLALNLTDVLLKIHGFHIYYQPVSLLDDAFILLYGPILYFYTYLIIYKNAAWKRKWWWHLIPFLSVAGFLLFVMNWSPPDQQDQLLQSIQTSQLPFAIEIAVLLVQLHPLIYLMVSFTLLRGYRRSIRQQFSNVENLDLPWLRLILGSASLLMVVAFIHALMPVLFEARYVQGSLLVLVMVLLFFVNRVLLKALRHSELFQGISQPIAVKYQGSTLTPEKRNQLTNQLQQLLEKEKLYLDADLTIDLLAESLKVPSKTLSQVINQSYGRSFFEWINSYRIREAQKLLLEQPQATVLEILYLCGYNSKSSFNAFFKKYTGSTPTAFRALKKK